MPVQMSLLKQCRGEEQLFCLDHDKSGSTVHGQAGKGMDRNW